MTNTNGDVVFKSMRIMNDSMPISNGHELSFLCDVVKVDVLLLLGVDHMRWEGMIVDVRDMVLRGP